MTDRKKPGVAFWATVVVVVVLAYPLSFGPACWITSRTNVGAEAVPVLFQPLTWAMSPDSETTINRVSRWYAKIGAPDDWEWGPSWEESPSGIGRSVVWWWGLSAYITPPPAFFVTPPPPPPYLLPPRPSDEPGEQFNSVEAGSGGSLSPDD